MTLRKKIFIPLIVSLMLIVSSSVFAGDPPPVGGDPGDDPNGTEIGGSAPIGSGLILMLSLGLAYTSRKTYLLSQEED